MAFTPDSKEVYYLDDGRVQAVTLDRRETRAVSVTAELDVDFARDKTIVFDQAWRLIRDQFFDPQFNGVDWTAARANVEPYIAGARTPDEMRRIASLMIGELNASHMGINAPAGGAGAAGGVGHLGLDFDRAEYDKSGRLTIAHVIPLGPAALAGLHAGDEVIDVDGERIQPQTNLDALLENKVGRAPCCGSDGSARTPDPPAGRRGPAYFGDDRGGLATASGWPNGAIRAEGEKHWAARRVHMPDMSAGSRCSSTWTSTPTTSRATAS